VIVDEASMASTLDLDPLITAAARAGAKVVLVGDPAQIGVINGPGGMLAALAHAGHGVELAEIHRFSQRWERQASLALRHGQHDALTAYRGAGRLHPCQDGDAALDGVFGHWAAARADGQDALMLARTRLDVDALNQRARAAALTAGAVTGPVTVAGGRDWQAGDVLRLVDAGVLRQYDDAVYDRRFTAPDVLAVLLRKSLPTPRRASCAAGTPCRGCLADGPGDPRGSALSPGRRRAR